MELSITIAIVSAFLALIAAIFAGMGVYLSRRYHRINLLHTKSENLQKFISTSWRLLSEYETIKNALQKSEAAGAKFIPDSKMQLALEDKLKELLALGKAITISDLFSSEVHKEVTGIYSLFRSVFDRSIALDEITVKIKRLQDLYDRGIMTK